ncbi:hypothetical protein [Cecembia lonarensis]|uniref:Lipocalin-like domain-containing protein n=1 Tax=Cecembia lonarensis (strain CCUG 58316 / KCTC 22772 / LW9) TaxID=1225176 RepID=K1L2Y3_CECL9|nr:hypothetical protein [Cecembia lonarensis]EKB49166.1 hypothetical protein B879_02177 [Cecembia lonarensis LW9]
MRAFLLLLFLSFFMRLPSFSQNFEGTYLGSLIGSHDLILIEKDNKHYKVTLHTGENTSILSVGMKKSNGLSFEIPLNDGEELEVFAKREGDMLTLEFVLEQEKHKVSFSSLNKSSVGLKSSSIKEEIDKRLIGTWKEKQTYNLDGSLNKALDNSSKNYKVVYTKDGRYIHDSRFFRDLDRKNGGEFQFTDIPIFYYSTISNKKLNLKVPSINTSEQVTYEIFGDSLIVYERMHKTVFLREK